MSVIGSNILAGASGQGGGYNLTKSLRFRSSASAYLNRTPASASNQKTWTFSFWVKRGLLSSFQYLYGVGGGSNDSTIAFYADDSLAMYLNDGAGATGLRTTQVFRDPSAWYHVVINLDTTQATASNRMKMYINGTQVTAFQVASYPNQNTDWQVNTNAYAATIGRGRGGSYSDCYMAEYNFIDGQALTPSSFGETSTTTGVWIPKKYGGTYGTNGFYLKFTDTTSTSTLGTDFSGNSNTWTVNNISLTSGSTYDSMTDVPTLTSATTANYCVMNPLKKDSAVTLTDGNLYISSSSGAFPSFGSMVMNETDGYYAEFLVASTDGVAGPIIGVADVTTNESIQTNMYVYKGVGYRRDGQVYRDNSLVLGSLTALTVGATLSVAYKTGKVWFGVNGVWQNSGNPAAGTGQCATASAPVGGYVFATNAYSGAQASANFGQQPFKYTVPTGFVALNTFNLPTPTIGYSASELANEYFDVSLYTGTGATQSIVNSGSMQPDFVWTKARSNVVNNILVDSVRGGNKILFSDLTLAEQTASFIDSFNSNGWTVNSGAGTGGNQSGYTYVGWQWRASNATAVTNTQGSITSTVSASTTAGFSIVTYTGTGANATVGHGLGVTPSMILLKCRTVAHDWRAFHGSFTSGDSYLRLNTTAATASSSTIWNGTLPTSSVFSVGTDGGTNQSSQTFVAYCFAPIAGYSAMGSYTGNGSADGPFIYTGFRPRFVLIKCSSGAGTSWIIYDSSRNTYNATTSELYPNTSGAETNAYAIDFLSNGFKIRNGTTSNLNDSGSTQIYAAFAESPFKYSLSR